MFGEESPKGGSPRHTTCVRIDRVCDEIIQVMQSKKKNEKLKCIDVDARDVQFVDRI